MSAPNCEALVYHSSGNWGQYDRCAKPGKHTVNVKRNRIDAEAFTACVCGSHRNALGRGYIALHNPAEDKRGFGARLGLQMVELAEEPS